MPPGRPGDCRRGVRHGASVHQTCENSPIVEDVLHLHSRPGVSGGVADKRHGDEVGAGQDVVAGQVDVDRRHLQGRRGRHVKHIVRGCQLWHQQDESDCDCEQHQNLPHGAPPLCAGYTSSTIGTHMTKI